MLHGVWCCFMYDGAAVQSAVALHIWTVWATCLSRYMVCAGCGAPRHWLDLLACKAYANCFAGCSACPQFRGVDQATETAVAPAATPSHCCGLYLWGGCRVDAEKPEPWELCWQAYVAIVGGLIGFAGLQSCMTPGSSAYLACGSAVLYSSTETIHRKQGQQRMDCVSQFFLRLAGSCV